LAPNWYGIRYDRLEENGMQWPVTDLDHPGTPYLHAPRPALPTGRGRFFPSSTSLPSRSRTPSTRSCSRPAERSITTTRRT
jgi:predicted molibdopterin-dependent oxidoreductase YjgC